jgi:predicted GIY-YIG superfamily endonuclease
VYKMECTSCESNYIGSTWRRLHQRVREHLSQRGSLVYQHNMVCKSEWRTSILYECHHLQQLRFMEAMAIKKLSPNLNGKDNLFDSHIVF